MAVRGAATGLFRRLPWNAQGYAGFMIAPDADRHTIRALVVDGNLLSRSIVVSQLRDFGVMQIQQVGRAQDARKKLEVATYDLVVCEYHFDRTQYTGRDLLDDLRQNGLLPLSTTFVMVTGEASYACVAEAAEAALDGYLLKPYTANSLFTRISAARTRKRELKEIFDAIEGNDMGRAAELCLSHFEDRRPYWLYTARIGAEISISQGNIEMARHLYEVVTAEKALPWARLGIARVQGAEGLLGEARTTLENLIADHRSYADAYDVMGKVQIGQGDLDAAYETYAMACEITPSSITRLQKAGLMALYTGRTAEAERLMERVVRIGLGSKMFDPIAIVVLAFCKYLGDDDKWLQRCADDIARAFERDPLNLRLKRFADITQALVMCRRKQVSELAAHLEAMVKDVLSPSGDFEAASNIVRLLGLIAERVSNKEFADRTIASIAARFCSSRVTLDVLLGAAEGEAHQTLIRGAWQALNARIQAAMAQSIEGHHEAAVRALIAGAKETRNARFVETAEGSLKRHGAKIAKAEELAAVIEALRVALLPGAFKDPGFGGREPGSILMPGSSAKAVPAPSSS